jgi:uncharacterized protein with GYD domain
MAMYLTRARYSPAAFQGMVANPSDRGAAAKAMFEAAGIKLQSIYFSVSTGEVVCILEGTVQQMSVVEMVVMASGAFSYVDSDELVSMGDMHTAMRSAGPVAAKFRPANAK